MNSLESLWNAALARLAAFVMLGAGVVFGADEKKDVAPAPAPLLTVAVTLVIAVLPTYLLLGEAGADIARSGAVLAWLVGHALVAWTLRSRPRLSWKANAAFPIWAAAAILVGLLLVLTPLGQIVHLVTLSVSALLTALSCTVIGCIVATLLRLFLPSSSRL